MEAYVDNIWSTHTTLHFRVCVVTGATHRLFKKDFHILLEDIEGALADLLSDMGNHEVDPTTDPQQGSLFAAPESHGQRR